VKDARRAPFCYQTLAAVNAIRARFPISREHPTNRERTVAQAIYLALTFEANEQRRRDGFRASRKRIAELAGTSDRTLDRYVAIFEELGLLEVERQRERDGGMHLPNLWTLIEQTGSEAPSLPAKEPRHGGERASPGVAKLGAPTTEEGGQEGEEGQPPPRPSKVTMLRSPRGARRDYDEATR